MVGVPKKQKLRQADRERHKRQKRERERLRYQLKKEGQREERQEREAKREAWRKVKVSYTLNNTTLTVGISDIWMSLLLPIYFESFHYRYSIDAYVSRRASTAGTDRCLQALVSTMTLS
jgi:hypothetical protein